MKHLFILLKSTFEQLQFTDFFASLSASAICLLSIFLIAYIVYFITRKVLISIIHKLVEHTKTKWDDFLLHRKVFKALAHTAPAFILYLSYGFSDIILLENILYAIVKIYFTIIVVMVFSRTIYAAQDIYMETPISQSRSIKGYVQLLQIFIYFVGGIFIISALMNRSPMWFITGLGAIAAVLLLVFKDTILGLTASIQLSANNMLKPGDWIEMPGHNADGTVIDITLNTVKVQNWDKTITTIPTYALVSESFYNWKGMEESGGRRIKRSINIDMKSVRFCDSKMLSKFEKFLLIKDYVLQKQNEISEFNKKHEIDENDIFNARRQTNLGVFRKYLEAYLKNHPLISDEMTFLIRHLQPSEKGLPIEIYVFCTDQRWANFEAIQADIFDHVLAVIPEFELRVFQHPAGSDLNDFLQKLNK